MMDFRSSDLSSSSSCSVLEDELVSSDQSTETTDWEDDYIAELTRQMTRDMLQDDHDNLSGSEENQAESLGSVSWPQYSTLWSPLGSSYGSPEGGPSLEPTPPVTPDKARPWNSCSYADVLRKLDKLDTANERSSSPQGISASTTKVAGNTGVGLCSKQSLASDQSQDVQKFEDYNRGRSQAKIGHDQQFDPNNYQHQKKGGACGGGGCANNGGRPRSPTQFGLLPPSNQWLNPQPQSGMRAVFLGGAGAKIGPSGGTGVFLPCVIGNTSQSPKKRGCSPVLIPAKVVQALKVHFDRVGDLPRPNATDFSRQNDGLKGGRASTHSTTRRHSRGMPADMNHNEMGLPQEWTY